MAEIITIDFKTRRLVSVENSNENENVPHLSLVSCPDEEDLSPKVVGEDENFVYVSDSAGFVNAFRKKNT